MILLYKKNVLKFVNEEKKNSKSTVKQLIKIKIFKLFILCTHYNIFILVNF